MLLIENLSEKQLQDVRIECSYLFSFELARDDEFVINLKLTAVSSLEKWFPILNHQFSIANNRSPKNYRQ